MTTLNTLAQEIAALVGGNTLYNDKKGEWTYLLNSYLGGEDYRKAGYLTRYQLETDQEYAARLKATALENHCASVISVYNSFLFRECPKREFEQLEMMPELEDFLEDADMDGRSIDQFMKDVATWSSVFGHCWIIVAKPDVGAQTRADEIAENIRPYVNLLTPLVVLDWSWTRKSNGRYSLDYLRYAEDINGDVHTIKEWTPEIIKTSIVDVYRNQVTNETVEVNGLGKIPAVIAYNGRSIMRGIGVSDINDIADAQRFIYNATSEIDQSIRLDSHPSLVKTPDTQAGVGAGAIIHMPDNLDPNLKPYILDFAGANITNILASITHTVSSIDKMANTGSVRATETRTLSGVAMETEFQLLNARLSEKADNLELAEEQMWKLWAEYMGTYWAGKIEYPGSFNIRDTQREIDQLVKVKSAATDPRVVALVDHELVEFLGEEPDLILGNEPYLTAEQLPQTEFFEPHYMINPQTGEKYIARTQEEHMAYAELGYIHEEKY